MELKFETQTCSRCRGAGKYSFCEYYGDRCFKCAGDGEVLTKRGQAAKAYYIKSCSVELGQLNLGDAISVESFTNGGKPFKYVAKVIELGFGPEVVAYSGTTKEQYIPIQVTTDCDKYGKYSLIGKADTLVRIYRKDDFDRLVKSIAYQNSLTKSGTARKTKPSI